MERAEAERFRNPSAQTTQYSAGNKNKRLHPGPGRGGYGLFCSPTAACDCQGSATPESAQPTGLSAGDGVEIQILLNCGDQMGETILAVADSHFPCANPNGVRECDNFCRDRKIPHSQGSNGSLLLPRSADDAGEPILLKITFRIVSSEIETLEAMHHRCCTLGCRTCIDDE